MASTTVRVDGTEIRRRRIWLRYPQREMAAKIGMDQGYLSRLECGRRDRVSVQMLARIEAHLGRLDEPASTPRPSIPVESS
ncbi:helix-turn-helix transcriptional regulator [Frankia sp. EUN1f]|uniref:helix-turn-helix domain-containing protein n=1 Tax=Parafrankia sp. EUN1f TaxID=102897 RepID=UPI0012F9B9EC